MSNKKQSYTIAFSFVILLFFLWGFAHNLDSVLIPHLKKACQLSNRQSMLVDTSVFFAYFIMAIPAGIIMKKFGYKVGIITGLILFATGAFLFIPAANNLSFGIFILGLFIIGSGLTILETAANPYAAVLGPEESSTFRLNLAQAFNGFAVTLAPVIGGRLIFSGKNFSDEQLNAMGEVGKHNYLLGEAASVKLPYIVLGTVLLLVAGMFIFVKLPEIQEDRKEKISLGKILGTIRIPNLRWAVIAQFFYVGAQVCVTSIFIRIATTQGHLSEFSAADFLGFGYGLIFTIGRFVGVALMKYIPAKKLLAIYAAVNILICILIFNITGIAIVYALAALGFFMSIMFPTIFSLGIQGLGSNTKPGASLIVMSIAGGAVLPPIMGTIIDFSGDNLKLGFAVPLICYAVVLAFAIRKNGYEAANVQVAMSHAEV